MTTLRRATALIALGMLSPRSDAQCVDWTPGFHVAGITGAVIASALFDDGTGNGVELYLGGSFQTAGDLAVKNIVKWNGTRWAALGDGRPSFVTALAVWDDGSGPKLYAATNDTESVPAGGTLTTIAGWDGSTWTGLPGGVALQQTWSMTVHDDGSGPALYIGALFTDINGAQPAPHAIARFGGTGWSAVGSGLFGTLIAGVLTMKLHDDGSGPKLYVGSYQMSTTPGGPQASVWSWDGSAWSNAAAGWSSTAWAQVLEVVRSGTGAESLYGGTFDAQPPYQNNLMQWNGSSWLAVGPNLNGSIQVMQEIPQPGADSLLVAGGNPNFLGGIGGSALAVWSNSQWSALAAPLQNGVRTLALYDEGAGTKLFAGLNFLIPGTPRGVARLDGTTWATPGSAGAGGIGEIEQLQAVNEATGPKLYVCGRFAGGPTQPDRVMQLVGHTWSTVGTVFFGGHVHALCAFDDGVHGTQLYVGGAFTGTGGSSMNRVARWNGSTWSGLGPGLADVAGGGSVFALTPYDDGSGMRLFAVGNFNISGGAATPYIAQWDGTQWSHVGGGFDAQARCAVVFDDGSGPALYVGGFFLHAGGVPANHVARWNGTTWSALGGGTPTLNDLIVHDDGNGPKLYARSDYSNPRLSRWDGATWQAPPGGPDTADAIASYDDGTGAGPRLYVAGSFGAQYGAAFDGTSWSPMGTGLTGTVNDFAVFDDGQGPALFAGGQFTRAGAFGSVNIARYGPTGACTPITGTVFCAGDGTGTACPCGNVGATRHGCASSTNAAGAALIAEGQAHLSSDTVTLRASGVGASASLLFFQGTGQAGGGLGVAFGDGLRCVNGTVVRLAVRQASAGSASFGHAVAGDPHVSFAGHLGAMWTTRNYQAWYRDAQTFCTSALYNLTNGVEIRWAP